ncbi:putative Acyltransferase family protein [Desulfovibrionales bacterium]
MRKHIIYINIINIIAIFAVCTIHVSHELMEQLPGLLSAWWTGNMASSLSRFAVPIFIMCSGAMLMTPGRIGSVGNFYVKRLPKLVIPLLSWSFIYYFVRKIFFGEYPFGIEKFLKKIASCELVGHFWFSYMLIQVYLAVPFLFAIFYTAPRAMLAIFFGLFFFFESITPILVYFFDFHYLLMNTIFTQYVAFFVLGMVLSRVQVKGRWKQWLLIWVYLLCSGAIAWGTWRLKLINSAEPYLFMQYESPGVVAQAVALFLLLESFSWERLAHYADCLARISGATYGIYLCHILVRDLWQAGGLGVANLAQQLPMPALGLAASIFLVYLGSFILVTVLRAIPFLRWIVY